MKGTSLFHSFLRFVLGVVRVFKKALETIISLDDCKGNAQFVATLEFPSYTMLYPQLQLKFLPQTGRAHVSGLARQD